MVTTHGVVVDNTAMQLVGFAGITVVSVLTGLIVCVLVGSCLCHMMPASGGNPVPTRAENFNYRIPPAWSPKNDRNYSF